MKKFHNNYTAIFLLAIFLVFQTNVKASETKNREVNNNECGTIIDKSKEFVPLISIIVDPDKFDCTIVNTRGFVYFKNQRYPSLYMDTEKKKLGWRDYSINLPPNARAGFESDGIEAFVIGLFMKDVDRSYEPEIRGYIKHMDSIEKGIINDKGELVRTKRK